MGWPHDLSCPSLLAVLTVLLAATMTTAAPLELYVKPDGNDQATGRSEAEAWATLSHARDELRGLRQAGQLTDGAVVWVLPGTYHLGETLAFGADDSGTAEAPVVFRGRGDAKPVIQGGVRLEGWRPYQRGIYQCDLAAAGHAGLRFGQLFFNGQRMVLARAPNLDPDDIHGGTWGHVADVDPDQPKTVFYHGNDIGGRYQRPQDGRVCIFPGYDWAWNRIGIKEIRQDDKGVVLAGNTSYEMRIGDRYYVENLFEELDAPGEWYLDQDSNTVYFLPPSPVEQGEVAVALVQDLVSFDGASDIGLTGFVLEDCDRHAVNVLNSVRCQVAASVIRNCGAWGVTVNGGSECQVVGCDIYDTGSGGIALNGGDRKTLIPSNHLADNNYIHHIAHFLRTYNTAINLNGVGNRATHNLIHDTPHAGVVIGGNDNVLELNSIHHTNLQSADTGGIYSCPRDWTQRGNIIRWNLWHDIGGYGKANSWEPVRDGKVAFEYPHFTWGIYMDDPTSGNLIYGNILYDVPICGLHNHGGRDNVLENNVLVDCPALQAGMLSPEWSEWTSVLRRFHDVCDPGPLYFDRYPALRDYTDEHPEAMTGGKFVRNIVYYTDQGTAWLRGLRAASWGGESNELLYSLTLREEDLGTWEFDGNLIYAEAGIVPTINLTRRPQPNEKLTWDQWRALGLDQHSQLGDPKFVDPAHHDYRLQPDSPALALGFKPIPVEQIGPQQDPPRASWPIVEAPGATGKAQPIEQLYQPPGFEPVPAQELVARGGLGNFFAKLAEGRAVKVAYYGGGIHSGGWRSTWLEWLRRTYPTSEITEINASICDCVRGSSFSVYRFGHDVLAQFPDLVLVDYTSDDYNASARDIYRAVEAVVRQAWTADPAIDLVFVHAFRDGFETSYAEGNSPPAVSAYERVAEHYGIPSLNLGYPVAQLAAEGKLAIKGDAPAGGESFSADGVRPSSAGNRIYGEALVRGLTQLAERPGRAEHTLPKPLARDNLERAKEAPITRAMLAGEWRELPKDDEVWPRCVRHFDTIWFTDQPGATLTFRFTGTTASLFDLMGPDTGRVKVTVDGKVAGIRQQVDPWAYYQRLSAIPVADGLPDQEHTVVVELLPGPPDRSVPIAEAKRLNRYDEKAFEGVALRIGCIRVVGEVLE